jgi:hypothetical protein
MLIVKNRVPGFAFLLACLTSAIATFGFLFEQGSRIDSTRRTVGDGLSLVGAPGLVVAATITGGHQTSLAATAIVGTILNTVLYSFLWSVILVVASKLGKKSPEI